MFIIAAIFIIPTAITGFFTKDFYPVDDPDVYKHLILALATALFTLLYAVFRADVLFNHKPRSLYLYLFLGPINIALVSTTAEFGGIVVRGKGIVIDSSRS